MSNRVLPHVQSFSPGAENFPIYPQNLSAGTTLRKSGTERRNRKESKKADRPPCPVWLRNSLQIKATAKSGQQNKLCHNALPLPRASRKKLPGRNRDFFRLRLSTGTWTGVPQVPVLEPFSPRSELKISLATLKIYALSATFRSPQTAIRQGLFEKLCTSSKMWISSLSAEKLSI